MPHNRQMIIVEDDPDFAKTLKRSFERRDYDVCLAAAFEDMAALLKSSSPSYAVVAETIFHCFRKNEALRLWIHRAFAANLKLEHMRIISVKRFKNSFMQLPQRLITAHFDLTRYFRIGLAEFFRHRPICNEYLQSKQSVISLHPKTGPATGFRCGFMFFLLFCLCCRFHFSSLSDIINGAQDIQCSYPV